MQAYSCYVGAEGANDDARLRLYGKGGGRGKTGRHMRAGAMSNLEDRDVPEGIGGQGVSAKGHGRGGAGGTGPGHVTKMGLGATY